MTEWLIKTPRLYDGLADKVREGAYVVVANGMITDVGIGGQGCSISQSSASMMSAAIKGKSVNDARGLIGAFKAMMSIHENEIGGDGSESDLETEPAFDSGDVSLGDLEALRGVVKFPVRIKCATLSWNTLAQAIDEAAAD